MANAGVRDQTIKAQLIYMSYFEDVQNFNAESYANLFAVAPNDSDLIAAINSTYGLEIDYDEFMRTGLGGKCVCVRLGIYERFYW